MVLEGWSRDNLEPAVQRCLHLSHGAAANNFDAAIPEQSEASKEIIKDPYRLDFTQLTGRPAERDLEDALVANLVPFLTELGMGFAFVGRQYPIEVGGEDFRIDLLFYHCKLHCYVVVELKTRGAAPQHLGRLGFYVEVVDDLVRDKSVDNPTIGILIAVSKNQPVIEYSLRSQRNPLAVGTYEALPQPVRDALPSGEALSRLADRVLHTAQKDS